MSEKISLEAQVDQRKVPKFTHQDRSLEVDRKTSRMVGRRENEMLLRER